MFKERKQFERNLLENMLDWRVAARSAIHLYRKTGVSKEEADRAATLIKARNLMHLIQCVTLITFRLRIKVIILEGKSANGVKWKKHILKKI